MVQRMDAIEEDSGGGDDALAMAGGDVRVFRAFCVWPPVSSTGGAHVCGVLLKRKSWKARRRGSRCMWSRYPPRDGRARLSGSARSPDPRAARRPREQRIGARRGRLPSPDGR